MKLYRVESGVARFGAGMKLVLTEEQVASRAHKLDVVEEHGKHRLVILKEPIEMKIGEVVGIDSVDRYLETVLVPAKASDDDEDDDGEDGGDGADYDKMSRAELDKMADERGIDPKRAKNKGDLVALLERADKVDAAVAADNFDVLTVDELRWLANEREIDASAANSKADLIALFKPAT